MTCWFYLILILGVILGGLVGLVLLSLLAMAGKGEESLERLELEMLRNQAWASPLKKRPSPDELSAPPAIDLYPGDSAQIRACNRG